MRTPTRPPGLMLTALLLTACGDDEGVSTDGEALSDGATDSGDTEPTGTSGEPPPPPPEKDVPEPDAPLAGEISITAVTVNQGVEITLADGGLAVPEEDRAAPVIGGRPAVFRALHETHPGFRPRELEAVLELAQADGEHTVYPLRRHVDGHAQADALAGAFTWLIAADELREGTAVRVELREVEGVAESVGAPQGAAFPDEGDVAPLYAWGEPMILELVLVPFECDGWGVQAIEPGDLTDLEAYVFNTYPLQAIDITVHAPVYSATCSEVDAAEFDLPALRESEGAAPHVYYGGLLPGDGAGYSIAPDGGDQMSYRRTFANHTWRWYGLSFDLFAHELGHNHGRDHSFEDPAFPGANHGSCGARITRGLGLVPGEIPQCGYSNDQEIGIPWIDASAELLPPTEPDVCDGLPDANRGSFSDFMSYAYPYWVSAYTYAALAERVRLISSWRSSDDSTRALTGVTARGLVSPEGGVRWARSAGAEVVEAPAGVARCFAGDTLLATLDVGQASTVRERRRPDGAIAREVFTSLSVPMPAGARGDRCELHMASGERYRFSL